MIRVFTVNPQSMLEYLDRSRVVGKYKRISIPYGTKEQKADAAKMITGQDEVIQEAFRQFLAKTKTNAPKEEVAKELRSLRRVSTLRPTATAWRPSAQTPSSQTSTSSTSSMDNVTEKVTDPNLHSAEKAPALLNPYYPEWAAYEDIPLSGEELDDYAVYAYQENKRRLHRWANN
jgi:hypothetical protein